MPVISLYSCNKCDFQFPEGWGGYTYAVDRRGCRVVCPHPSEGHAIEEVTGLSYAEACEAGLVGHAQHCVCLDCLKQFDLDLERDASACPDCSSARVRSLRASVGKPCPRCKIGLIEQGSLIRWTLDPDWEQLPVPQVVKDLTEFAEQHRVPASLQQAAKIANSFGGGNFGAVARLLLRWWEGDYISTDQEQQDSIETCSEWTWCKALSAILEATPALAELVVIRGQRCWFAEGVSPDVRRGIKNYLRKYRTHVVWT
jgi:hypothetical protein